MNEPEIQNMLNEMNERVRRNSIGQGIYSLGEMILGINTLSDDINVVIDTGGTPSGIDSYRGYYERLAIEPGNRAVNVAEFRAMLTAADGETYQGYKGGDFYMDRSTLVHVAPYGSTGSMVVGYTMRDSNTLVILTKDEVY